jgi:hypothetical protein
MSIGISSLIRHGGDVSSITYIVVLQIVVLLPGALGQQCPEAPAEIFDYNPNLGEMTLFLRSSYAGL